MEVNPAHIKNKKFSSSFKGFNKKEVKNFITHIAKALEELLEKNKRLSEQVGELKRKVDEYQSKKEKLDNLLVSARKKADRLVKDSQDKAEFTIKEAEVKARKMQEEENKKLKTLKTEVERLSHQKKLFLSKFRTLLRSQVELLKFYGEQDSPSENSTTSPASLLPDSVKKIIFEED